MTRRTTTHPWVSTLAVHTRAAFRTGVLAALIVAQAACSKSDDKGAGSGASGGGGANVRSATYTLSLRADQQDPPGGLKVSLKVPTSWKEEVDKTGEPSFAIPGRDFGVGPALGFIAPSGDTPADRMTKAIGLQYDAADLAAAKREDLPDGRVWIAHTRGDGYVHARLFAPAPGDAGVVMCLAIFKPEEASNLPALRTMCDSLTFGGG